MSAEAESQSGAGTMWVANKRARLSRRFDTLFSWATFLAGWGTVALLAWIALEVGYASLPAFKQFGFGFLIGTDWDPVDDHYGALPLIYGTLVSAALALVLSMPLGVAIAIFLTEDYLPPKVRGFFKFLVELLAAIPSVIYGLWGIYVVIPITTPLGNWLNAHFGWIPLFSTPSSGPGFFPASFVLAIMILPTVAALSGAALKATPLALKEGAAALGATRWDVILQISLPIAASGIFGAAVLALGRAMGETMALAMLIGNNNQINPSLFASANTIASLLANSFGEATGLQVAALMYLSFILMALTLGINAIAEVILERTGGNIRHI
ncbi:MAG: phosphate ABC transporter permease subunit PstC [Methylacidiphilales bacterium]|nr:phosphate ABC transporter permease subunit PstC [Candidatus Methylacidiphilales bacterium]